ncbi:MAG TPA: hypothetical protein VG406_18030, partial [Isosphaeraceae bacterium]|nr:hypothetical protein [Isosphaeraceae bacterium]
MARELSAAPSRDAARGNTRLRLEQWARNPTCEPNTISAVRNVRMAAVAKAEGIPETFGQSPFAIARGLQFERELFEDDAKRLIGEIITHGVLPAGASGCLDLRLRRNGGARIESLDNAIAQTKALALSGSSGKCPDSGCRRDPRASSRAVSPAAAPDERVAVGVPGRRRLLHR